VKLGYILLWVEQRLSAEEIGCNEDIRSKERRSSREMGRSYNIEDYLCQ
jgi:hypothetical protein